MTGPEPHPFEDHFHNPRNAGMLEDPDLHVEVENPVCGDVLHLYINFVWERSRDTSAARRALGVAEVRFQVYGCPAAIAAGSVLTELIRDSSVARLRSVQRGMISEELGGLPAESTHAAVLAEDALAQLLSSGTM